MPLYTNSSNPILNCIIIEDEHHSYELLKTIIEEYVPSMKLIGHATSIHSALDLLQKVDIEVVFMDIQLSDGLSFEILYQLGEWDFSIIFTTAFNQYALEAFKVEAIDYLLKPYSPKQVVKAVEKVLRRVKNTDSNTLQSLLKYFDDQSFKSKRISIVSQDGISFIEKENIIYCEAEGAYCKVITEKQGTILCSKSLKAIQSTLEGDEFVRVHSSFLVNLTHIFKYVTSEGGFLIMSNGAQIPASRKVNKNILLKWLENK